MLKLSIEGMSCQHCVARVQKALASVAGVENAKVDLDTKTALVSGSPDKTALKAAVDDVGFAVVGIETV